MKMKLFHSVALRQSGLNKMILYSNLFHALFTITQGLHAIGHVNLKNLL
jgi:hypothetical protein